MVRVRRNLSKRDSSSSEEYVESESEDDDFESKAYTGKQITAGPRHGAERNPDDALPYRLQPYIPLGRGRAATDISKEQLAAHFHLQSEAACQELKVGLTVLKRQCRKYKIGRWPYRKIKSLERLILHVESGMLHGFEGMTIAETIAELHRQKASMLACEQMQLDPRTKKLQQAYSKANHKARRQKDLVWKKTGVTDPMGRNGYSNVPSSEYRSAVDRLSVDETKGKCSEYPSVGCANRFGFQKPDAQYALAYTQNVSATLDAIISKEKQDKVNAQTLSKSKTLQEDQTNAVRKRSTRKRKETEKAKAYPGLIDDSDDALESDRKQKKKADTKKSRKEIDRVSL